MRHLLIIALLGAGFTTTLAHAQVRVPGIVQRVIPGTRQQPPAPQLIGIDALRADFIARTGSDTIYFGGDSSLLSAPARATLAAQAAWLRQNPYVAVRIEGHADPSDTRDHALAVGARRAEAVRAHLILLGVPPGQIGAVSMGKERPAVVGTTGTALSLNRRAVTVLVK